MSDSFRLGAATMFLRERTVASTLESIARAGYQAAEVWMEHLEGSGEAPAALAGLARSLGLALTLHATSYDLNPTSRNPGIARESRRQIEASLAAAAALQADLVVVHPGRRSSSRETSQEIWTRLLDWVGELDLWAGRLGLPVALELMERRPKEVFMLPSDAARLMAHPWQRMGLTVDVAHLNTHGDPVAFLAQLNPAWITHIHLSDNSPDETHLPLGEGRVDIPTVWASLAQRCHGVIVSLEGYQAGRGEELLARNLGYLRHLGAG